MAYKDISAQLSDENKGLVIQKFKEVEAIIDPFAVNLTPEERISYPVLGKKLFGFAETTIEYQRNHPQLALNIVDLAEQEEDMALTKQLREVLEVVGPIYEKIKDTYMAVSAETYLASRVFYDSVKAAAKAGVPGADAIARDLGTIYKKASRKSQEESETE